jgi:DNA replication protein DnaC
MDILLSRSRALNNIPARKVQEKLLDVLRACETCSKKELKLGDAFDGLCQKCSVMITAYNRYAESNIPIEYWDLKMERDFVGDPRLLEKYNELISDIKANFIKGTSICFAGNHGVGKSSIVSCFLKKAVQRGYTAMYSTLSDVVNVLTQAPSDEKFIARRELTMVDFLAVDELDPRFMATENAADLYARTLESIFRTRAQNKLPIFLCTNSPNVVESFSGSLKQSLDSLMKGHMQMFIVLGEDFRKKANKQ